MINSQYPDPLRILWKFDWELGCRIQNLATPDSEPFQKGRGLGLHIFDNF
jgi:hypothetical protein